MWVESREQKEKAVHPLLTALCPLRGVTVREMPGSEMAGRD